MSSVRSATSYLVKIGKSPLPSDDSSSSGTTTVFRQADGDALESLVLEDHVDMVEALTVRIAGHEQAPEWNIEIGMAVEAKFGAGSVLAFKGEVTSIEPSWSVEGLMTLTVRAYDHTHRLARGRKTRWFNDKTDTQIAQSVGAECQLSVEADDTGEARAYELQRNESNLTFLKRLAARNNFRLAVDEGKLIFKKADTSATPTTITMGTNLRSLRMAFNSVEQATKVIARGWDIREKKEIVGIATTGDVETIGGGSIGADDAEKNFGEAVAYITDVPITSQAQADALAKAEMNRLARQYGKGSCTVDGNDALRAGCVVEFAGLNTPYNGKYYILASRHIVNHTGGYLTEITFCSNTSGT